MNIHFTIRYAGWGCVLQLAQYISSRYKTPTSVKRMTKQLGGTTELLGRNVE